LETSLSVRPVGGYGQVALTMPNHLIAGLQRLLPMLTAGNRASEFADEAGPR
jgi:hypothetical protein